MECPRCGSDLERYTLDGQETVSCETCGYVGVPVDHRGNRHQVETWHEAISRVPDVGQIESVTVESRVEGEALEIVYGTGSEAGDQLPDPSVVRVERPDPGLAAALEAAEGTDGHVVCDVCGAAFETQAQLYGHLGTHSKSDREKS